MSGPAFSVFLPSYNKPAYVGDAIASVLAQTYGNWELWILENSDDGGQTRAAIAPLLGDSRIIYEEIELTNAERMPHKYTSAMLLNRYYPKAAGKFIAYISDDDVFEPQCFSRCLEEFAAHPDWQVVWFTLWRVMWDEKQGRFRPAGSIPAVQAAGAGTAQPQASCRIDGGQVVHEKACLDSIPQPWFPEERQTAHYSDGVFLQKLADRFTFWPVPDKLLTHRCTPASLWDKPTGRLT